MFKPKMEDKRMKATIENKSSVPLHGLKPGGKLAIETDRTGAPLNKEWRRRIADGKTDNAIIIIEKDKELTGAIKADKVLLDNAAKAAKSDQGGK